MRGECKTRDKEVEVNFEKKKLKSLLSTIHWISDTYA